MNMSRKYPHYLEKDKIKKMIDLADEQSTRDYMVLRTAWETGMRNSEIRKLKSKDIDHREYLITVRGGKGDKDRVIPITESFSSTLKIYKPSDPYKHVFSVRYAGKEKIMTGQNLRRIFRKYGDIAGIKIYDETLGKKRSVYPHDFRHSYAVHLLKEGVSLETVRGNLGHKSLETTKIYLDLLPEDRRKEIEKVNF